MTRTSLTNNQERHHKVSTGEQILTGGGADSGGSKPSSPKFLFLLEFHALYFGNIEKSENFQIFKKIIKKSLRIQGGPGGCVPIPTSGQQRRRAKISGATLARGGGTRYRGGMTKCVPTRHQPMIILVILSNQPRGGTQQSAATGEGAALDWGAVSDCRYDLVLLGAAPTLVLGWHLTEGQCPVSS